MTEEWANPMNHAQIRAFHTVAVEGSFTRAARALNVSQPTLSTQVKALEETYGVRLFDRRGRGIELTDLGQRLLAVSTRFFALEEEAETLLSDTRDLARGRLSLGADSPRHAMTLMAAIKDNHPGLTTTLKMGNAEDVLRDLLDYRSDIVVLSRPPEDEPRLTLVPFRQDRIVAIVPRNHPFAAQTVLTLEEIVAHPLVLREEGSVTRDVFQSALTEAGLSISDAVEIESREAVREAVAAGLGLGVVFDSETGRDSDIAVIPLAGAALSVPVSIACLRDQRRLATVRAVMRLANNLAATPDPVNI